MPSELLQHLRVGLTASPVDVYVVLQVARRRRLKAEAVRAVSGL